MKCEECGSENTYQDECSNTSCADCGGLFFFCEDCGYTDHPACREEEVHNEADV